MKVWREIEETKPKVVLMAVPCTPWTLMQNAHDPAEVKRKQDKAWPIVLFCIQIVFFFRVITEDISS